MIQVNELRIGNWVKYTQNQTTSTIRGIYSMSGGGIMQIEADSFTDLTVIFEAIPITGKILVNCGFEKDKYTPELFVDRGKDGYQRYQIYMDGDKNIFRVVGMSLCSCQYLHQLQNLYFALTQTELDYKP